MNWLDWLRGIDLPPWGRALPPIAVGYFSCARCGALSGGIAGKGPWKRLRADATARCRHAWEQVTLDGFRREATARFGIDWSRESAWWRREEAQPDGRRRSRA